MNKAKISLLLVSVLALGGCASGCQRACVLGFGPGNPVFNKLADATDSSDQCQTREFSTLTGSRLKEPGHIAPDYCKMRGQYTRYEIRDRTGHMIGTIQQR